VFPAIEVRARIASWLAGRDSHGPLIVLFALAGWGILVVPHILWAGFIGFALATGLMLLYGFDGGAGPLAYGVLAALGASTCALFPGLRIDPVPSSPICAVTANGALFGR